MYFPGALRLLALTAVAMLFALYVHAGEEKLPPIPVLEAKLNKYKAQNKVDTGTIELIKDLVDAYADVDLQKSIRYTQEAMEMAERLGNKSQEGSVYTHFGNAYRSQGLYELALEAYLKALKIWEQIRDTPPYIFTLNDIGNIYYDKDAMQIALQYYNSAYKLSQKNAFKPGAAVSLNNMALVSRKQGNLNDALKYHLTALGIRKQMGDAYLIAHSYNYIGSIYSSLGSYDSALTNFDRAGEIYYKIEHLLPERALVHRNRAYVYVLQKNYDQALAEFSSAEKIYKKINSNANLAVLYLEFGSLYSDINNFKEADKYYKQALMLAQMNNLHGLMRDIYFNMYSLNKDNGNYKQALDYYTRYNNIQDSIFNNASTRRILNLEWTYQLQKKDQELQNMDKENKLKLTVANRYSQLLAAAVLAVFIILVFLWFSSRRTLKMNKQLLQRNLTIEQQKQEIEKQNRALEQAKIDAEASAIAKTDFLSSMSHEIRTPMNGIVGYVNLLMESEKLSEEDKEKLLSVSYSADKLLHIINDVLHLSTIEAGKIMFENKPFVLRQLVNELILNIKAGSLNLDVNYIVDIDKEIPEVLTGDATRLYQILLNLLGNAKKFTKAGEIKLIIKKLWKTEDATTLQFIVSDTGIGIPADRIDVIFESFKQANAHIYKNYGGTGLGLAITKKLVELQGGIITVESTEGKGSEFTFSLPFSIATPEEVLNLNKENIPEVKNPQNLAGMQVLIVEDNPINQKVISMQLSRWGVKVKTANNGREALNKLENNNFDLVLLDIQMPEMDGLETTRYIRSKRVPVLNDSVPIIGLTADVFAETAEKAINCGMNEVLTKPAKPADLFSCLSRYYSVNSN